MRRMVTFIIAGLLGLALSAPVAHADPSPQGLAKATGYYLALGDSLAAGYQPGIGDDKTGGYVGGVRDALTATSPKTRLVNLACSGETSTTMVSGGRCDYELGSQLAQAVDFLTDHGKFTRVVTIDIGANDVQRCVDRATLVVDLPCVGAGLTAVATNLPIVLDKVRALAPHAKVVVLDYYNPFLAAWLLGPTGQATAQMSMALQAQLNGIIARATAGAGARLATISTTFRSTDSTPVTVPGLGTVPTNVATICANTWMCTKFDIHANDAGYALMAQTVAARL